MKKVAIVGAGHSYYGDFPEKGIKELFADAYRDMLSSVDKGVDPRDIEAAFIGSLSAGGGFQLGQTSPLLTEHVGLQYIPSMRVENACASGGYAIWAAVCAVASGKYKTVLAAGVEKMRDLSARKGRYWLGISGDTEYERLAGSTFPGIYAAIAKRYMVEHGLEHRHLARIAVKNHRWGAQNPKAQFQREIDLETAERGAEVAYPFNLWDCCSTTDGAAAVLITDASLDGHYTDRPIYIIGSGAGTDQLALHDRETLTSLRAVVKAAREAYKEAGLGPADIDLAEVHDCFTIGEVLAYSDLGFCEVGRDTLRFIEEGSNDMGGRVPVNLSGGLKAKGHPLGATGVGQAVEVFKQLRGQADKPGRQLANANTALTHNVGGSGGSATVFIYQRGEPGER